MGRNKKKDNFLEIEISRRDFIKYGLGILAGVTLGGYLLSKWLKSTTNRKLSSVFKNSAPDQLWKWSKEAYYYTKLGNNVKCNLCPNGCILEEGDRSICRNKVNIGGKLYTLAYGNPCAVHIDPIEKKPLFHFLPSTKVFSIATAGCNFRCKNCQNWTISQFKPEETQNYDLFPDRVVQLCLENKCQSIAYTYSEPTAFYEYMYDTAKLAREKGIKNLWITNGYINKEPLEDLCQYLDAANVDLKSFSEETYNRLNSGTLKPVLSTLKTLDKQGVWFEVTNLVIPTWTDDLDMIREMCKWLKKNIGPNYPLHFSRFHPEYKLTNLPPTPIKTLEDAKKIAEEEGLNFIYLGNVPGKGENTYCPKCGKLLVERKGFSVLQNNIQSGSCRFCGEKIAGVWEL